MGIFDSVLKTVEAPIAHPLRTAQDIGNGVARFGHWAWYGDRPGAGLGAVPGQFVRGFDPRTRAGLANIASLFAGGPKGDATPMMENLGMREQFVPYHEAPVSPLDRGITNEGPIRPSRGYNPSIQKMVERAHTNPFIRAPKAKADDQLNRLSQLESLRQRAAHAEVARRQLDAQLNAAPMAGKVGQAYPEHDAALIKGQSVINHPNFIRSMIRRQAQIRGFHHPN